MGRTVTAGRVSGLFGAKGEVSLVLYDDFPREINMEEPVFVKIDSLTVPLFFTIFARRGRKGATAMFDDIDSAGRAAELVGLEFSIRQNVAHAGGAAGESDDATPDGDELYFEDLVGWSVEIEEAVDADADSYTDANQATDADLDAGSDTDANQATDADVDADLNTNPRLLAENRIGAEQDALDPGSSSGSGLDCASGLAPDPRQGGMRYSGRIVAFHDSEFNPLLEIELDGAAHAAAAHATGDTVAGGATTGTELIPAQGEFVVEVDERRRKITLSIPEGLLGLNN
ncbi:MAG: hypothetical protein LBV18_03270 [Alistipes sp.]|jgi:ribosomal 30S subunit maturation factor RimM|nr:hypothetical protein [Alistipes sp.]